MRHERSSLAIILFAEGKTEEARAEALQAQGDSLEAHIMSAIVLSDGDMTAIRSDLFAARQRFDAAALLAYTYGIVIECSRGAPCALAPGAGRDARARIVSHRRDRARDATSVEEVQQRYVLGRFYFTHVAMREAPELKLIPGDWTDLVSPNVLLALDAFQGAKSE